VHDLIAITPLGSDKARTDIFPGLTISENPDGALASLSTRPGHEKAAQTAAKAFLGAALPTVGKMTTKGDFITFWTGPDQWVVQAPHDSYEDLAAQLKTAVSDAASVTEQTDGWAQFDLTGPNARAALERLCNVDTHKMQSGESARSSVEHLGCFVLCHEQGERYSIIGPRSSAASLHHALCATAISVT
jgi:sarcosine oxidase subunit gamma